MDHSIQLITYINSLSDFKAKFQKPYEHMGATIVDGILQAGINYDSVVKPRIAQIILNFPQLSVTSEFQKAIDNNELELITNWSGSVKLNRIKAVTQLFLDKRIETETDLGKWLLNSKNITDFKQLKGIGDKTADYFKILAGLNTAAIDRHLISFLNCAGIGITIQEYQKAHNIITETAISLNLEAKVLDHSIWAYMSSKKSIIKCY
jgi:hypothetical protein